MGKSVTFNNLVPGAKQHVGNWPGKTVEKKEGKSQCNNIELNIVDLPGTYSLTSRAIDELVSRNFILEEKPELVVDIVDASNIERNLYLTLLLLELETNIIIVLNMFDVAREKGYSIDIKKLSEQLNIPIISTVATIKEGIDELKYQIIEAIKNKKSFHNKINYGERIESVLQSISDILMKEEVLTEQYPLRWLAIKLLEEDEDVHRKVEKSRYYEKVVKEISEAKKSLGNDTEIILADKRYDLIRSILNKTVVRGVQKWTYSDMLDKVFLHKYLGLPIFLALMWLTFKVSFDISAPFMNIISTFFQFLSEVSTLIPNQMLASLIGEGIFGGLGFILSFIPLIFLLFFAIAILEDSGYLARTAFLMDRIMSRLGLQGRSFIPLLLGFGCNVPAMMATRSIEGEKDRLITLLINPFMSCSARLPVYILIAGAFFGSLASTAIWTMYFLGIIIAISLVLILRKTVLKGEPSPLIMELPLYKKPTFHGSIVHMWERGVHFLKKAGTYLLIGAVILWFLSSFPWELAQESIELSYAGQIGHLIEPIFRPLGFDWKIVSSLIFGFMAKEIIVESLGIIYVVEGEAAIATSLVADYTPLVGFTLMVFTLLYMPCLASIATMKQESGSWKWTIFQIILSLSLAFIVGLTITGIGIIFGFSQS